MQISSEAWAKYQRAHAMLQGEARRLLDEYFDSLSWDEDEERCLALLAQRAVELFNHYGLADATLSAAFYDEVMEMQGANVPLAEIHTPDARFVGRDVREAFEKATSRETRKILSGAAVSGKVKRAGIETMSHNAVRDHALWAWACIGDSCPFCRALGSNGWQEASRTVLAGSHAERIHDNCDCQFVVKKPGETLDIEGYDPDALRAEYEDASGGSSKDHINAMRRADYTPEKAAERNARRRELYAKQKESERDRRIHARIENAEVMHDSLYVGTPTEISERANVIGREERSQWENGFRKSDRSAAAYRRTYGAYVESFSPEGRITVEDFTRLEAKELQLAQWLADAGHTVDFRNANAHSTSDGKTTDVFLDHELWEFKRIESRRSKKIGERIAEKAEKQGPRFVADMSASTIDETVAEQKVAELLDNPFIEEIIIVINGKALRLKK